MTAISYVTLDNDDLGANKIFRAATASALDTNPVSIAQRGTGAPWLNGIGAIASLTSGSGNWTVPAGVYRVKATAIGAGGGAGVTGSAGSAGGNTTFGSVTAYGGGGGSNIAGGTGGTASGGDINLPGETGVNNGPARAALCATKGRGGNALGAGASFGGGSGGSTTKVFSVEPSDLIAYSVGSGGNGGTACDDGTAGIIIIEY